MRGLYTETVSAVKCGGAISDFFPVTAGVRQRCVLAPTLFNTYMDWVLGRAAEREPGGVSIGEVNFSDIDFADDAVMLAETVELLVASLEALDQEAKPLGLQISWIKTKIQAFDDCLSNTLSVSVCGENVEVLSSFTYLGSVIDSSGGCDSDVSRRMGLASGAMESLDRSIWCSRNLSKKTKIRVFKILILPVLLYGSETWTMSAALRARLNAFVTRSLRRIQGYRWNDFVPNQRLLSETEMRPATCLIRERQMRLFGHVARLPMVDSDLLQDPW
jgi:hypothetical protein